MIWPYIILAYFSIFCFGLSDNARGPVFPEILKEFGVNNSTGSWFYAVGSIFGFIGSWLCLRTLKKIDRIQNVYLSLVILACGFFGMGLSTEFWQLLTASACAGLGLGLLGVSINLLSAIGSNDHYRPRAIAGVHSLYALSSLIAPLLVTLIYSWGGGWRQSFFLMAALALLLSFAGMFFLKKEDEQLERKILGDGAVEFLQKGENQSSSEDLKGISILGMAVACYVYAEILMSSRLALYLRMQKSYDLALSSLYLTGFFIGLWIGRTIFSLYHPKVNLIAQLIFFLLISSVTILLGLHLHEGFLMLTGLAMGPFYGLSVLYLSKVFKRALNQAIAITISIQSFFLVAMHLGSGVLTDRVGISGAMSLGPIFLFLSAILFLGFHKWKKV